MSRGQENEVNTTAGNQNATFNTNAQTSYNDAQTDVGNYEAQLAKFAAANPYGTGGALQTAQNQATANTADAASQAAGQSLQGAAVRGGQNAGSAIAATEATNEANTRNLEAQQAQNNASRIGAGAQYGQQVLSSSSLPASLESTLSNQQANAGNTALETQQKAAETPSFGEELMGGLLQAGSSFAGGFGGGLGKSVCWIAAELYGGWDNPRVVLMQHWLAYDFSRRGWLQKLAVAAYKRWGERMAGWARRSRWVRAVLQRVFDAGLSDAEAWLATRHGASVMFSYTMGVMNPYRAEVTDGQ